MTLPNAAKLKSLVKSISSSGQKAVSDATKSKGETVSGTSTNAKLILSRLSKWGVPPAAAGAGAGVGLVAVSAGVKEAFGVAGDTAENTKDSIKKLSGWAIFIVILIVSAVFIIPKVRKAMK